MTNTKIVGTGLNGLVGSKVVTDLTDTYTFKNLDISDPKNPVDITNFDQVYEAVKASGAEMLLHFAAYTNVNGAWEQRGDKNGLAWQVNVVGTENIVKACQELGLHLVHISTAYVFDGDKEGMYTEEDTPNPIEWYGQTKYEAELRVLNSDVSATILRIDQPFRSDPFPRLDTAHRIIEGLKNGTLYPQFTDHYFGPTFIDDFVKVIDWVAKHKPQGVYHATSGESWTDYDFAVLINETLNLGGEVKKGSVHEYLKTLSRPYQINTALDTGRLSEAMQDQLNSITDAVTKL